VFAWVIFRADNLTHALGYYEKMFSKSLFHSPIMDLWSINTGNNIMYLSLMLLLFVGVEWMQREKNHALEFNTISRVPRILRWSFYYAIITFCFVMNGVQQEFIYFQF